MKVRMRFLALSLGLVFFATPVSADVTLEDSSLVVRGATVEEVHSNLGEPLQTRYAGGEGYGPMVEHWTYPDGLVVVLQGGYVIDSFTEKQN